eukprot:4681120-Pyramimonas_sp.AAC.1
MQRPRNASPRRPPRPSSPPLLKPLPRRRRRAAGAREAWPSRGAPTGPFPEGTKGLLGNGRAA